MNFIDTDPSGLMKRGSARITPEGQSGVKSFPLPYQ
jgi:hypothetical protein